MSNRIAYVDGLRAIAVSSVVLFHVAVHNNVSSYALPWLITLFLRNGSHGVDLFFVLSGFCLSYPTLAQLHAEGKGGFNVAGFAARRLVRILPPYYIAIGILFALGLALNRIHAPLPQSMDPAAVSPRAVVNQMIFVDNKYLASSFWTLAIEFRWYFLFPLVLWLWTLSRPLFASVAILSLSLAESPLRSIDLFCLPTFMLGIVAADIYVHEHRIARFAPFAFPILLAMAFASTANAGWYWAGIGPYWGIAMFCLVVAAGGSHIARRILSQKWIVLIGFTSYGIYLVHEPAIEFTERVFRGVTYAPVQFALGVCGGLALGMLFSLLAELPFVRSRLKNLLLTRLEPIISRVFGVCRIRRALRLSSTKLDARGSNDASKAVA